MSWPPRARPEFWFLELSARAGPSAACPGAAERFLQNILETSEAPKSPGASAGAAESIASPSEGFELAVLARTGTPPAAEPFKALKARFSFGVDLAAIEGLALVRFAENLISGVQFGKARGRLRVVLVGVRVQLLGLPPERALDLRGARVLRYPQDVVGVTHPQCLPGAQARCRSSCWAVAPTARNNVGTPAPDCNNPAQCISRGPLPAPVPLDRATVLTRLARACIPSTPYGRGSKAFHAHPRGG